MTRLGILTIFTTLLLAAPALAAEHVGHDGGEGWWGLTNDKIVTNAGFLVIGGLPILIFVLSMAQFLLDRRKDNRKKAAKARGASVQWKGGW